MLIRARRVLPVYAALVAFAGWLALSLQLYLSVRLSVADGSGVLHGVWMYLAFFTVLTNLFAAAVLTLPRLAPRSPAARFCASADTIAGTSANIALVCIAYNLLLRDTWNPQGLWLLADILLHDIVPALFVVYALLYTNYPRARFMPRLRWAMWPVLYFFYALLRGAATGFYPYPFINIHALGYVRVLGNAVGILSGYFVVAAALYAAERLLRRRLASA